MGCECYKIGGPWIAEDPECPQHGWQAQRDAEEREQERRQKEEESEELAQLLEQSTARIEVLEKTFAAIQDTLALKWIKVSEKPPVPGLIVKRFKSGSVWAGYYSGTEKESSFIEYIQLPN